MKLENANKRINEHGIIIAMTGTSGNMGKEALRQTLESEKVKKVKILLTEKPRNTVYARKLKKKYGSRIEIMRGDIAEKKLCEKLTEGTELVVNMAAVIPPKSDHNEEESFACNVKGAKNMTDAIKGMEKQAVFVHISSVAVYGNRDMKHPYGRVGDPLIPSPYDNYARHKCIAERYVMESGLESWCILRQTAMLHPNMLKNNIKDGLMFHTPFNAPLEWVSARDSGYLIKKIAEAVANGETEKFARRVFNICGGSKNRITGYETFEEGFSIIGGTPEKYLEPSWHATRNFHGMWFCDDELEEMFGYERDTTEKYWKEIKKRHPLYGLAKIIPAEVIKEIVFRPLLKDENAPNEWRKRGFSGKVFAYFGKEGLEDKRNWETEYIEAKQKGYTEKKAGVTDIRGMLLNHGYDESKPMSEWDIEDMKKAAEFRGGKCLSETMVKGDVYTKLEWECHDGHRFSATPYTVLKGGHWCEECEGKWDYDRQAKFSPFIAQIWYDTHEKDENMNYYYDEKGIPQCEETREAA